MGIIKKSKLARCSLMLPAKAERPPRQVYFTAMTRDSLVIYRSFYDAVKDLPGDIRLAMFDAIMEYGLNGEEPADLPPVPRALFMLIKPQIDANNRRYENGKRGGRPRKASDNQTGDFSEPTSDQSNTENDAQNNQTKTKPKPKNNQTKTKSEPNVNVNDNVNDNVEKKTTNKLVVQKKKISVEQETLNRKETFYASLVPFVPTYGKEMIREFFDYWSEMNRSKTKMRFEGEKVWELKRRLGYWARRSNNFNTTSNGTNQQTKEQQRAEREADAIARIERLRAEDAAEGNSKIRDA